MEIDPATVKLGKAPYVHDERTLMMARYLLPDIHIPDSFDFDYGRHAFPERIWGNDEYGDCVIAGEANHLLRLERIETRHTEHVDDNDAIARYKLLTGCQNPGDENDVGLEIIAAMRDWRHNGFLIDYKGRDFHIDAYGELDPKDGQQLRMSIYVLHGIHLGVWLPIAAQEMTKEGVWDYRGQTGPEWEEGSWGGHLVYAKKYDPDSISVMTWGMEIQATNTFIMKYADEAWALVDSLDEWRRTQTIDVPALEEALAQISGKVNE